MIHAFEFNPFAENTYIVYDENGECAIFDPGCYTENERQILRRFIEDKGLKPVRLINTHCHIDHVFGNRWAADTWGLELEIHRGEQIVLDSLLQVSRMYGIPNVEVSPAPGRFIEDNEIIHVGALQLKALLTPGHSPASLSFHCLNEGWIIAGDVLFYESIGRTDLPGGDYETLITSIRERLFTLPGETLVFPGHGPSTTIRHEREYNPFLN